MNVFSLLLADTVRVNAAGSPEILTKIAKDFVSVSYNINDKVCNEEYIMTDKNVVKTEFRLGYDTIIISDIHGRDSCLHSFTISEFTISLAIISPKGQRQG